ncbi:Hypp522 [Branchiostoma lanceolatum]|uniref:Hypp522 protein n=1 Tax=Branchiostoma lanceolatum TaxID=7740 RepID=A0A8J9W4J4_BRALA|nr:Hypp522 [Branchiostoma lanceolatum]
MAQSNCQPEKVRYRKERLARSTHVSKLVSSFEALTSQPRNDYTAAAGMTPVMTRRSVHEIKDELEGKTSTTPSEASVVKVSPQKPPRTKFLHYATPKSASIKEPQKTLWLCTQSLADTAVQTAAAVKQVKPATTDAETVASVSPQKPPQPHLIGDTAGATSDDVKPVAEHLLRTLGDPPGDTKVTVKTSRTQSVAGKNVRTALAVRQEQLLRTLLTGLPNAPAQTTITVTPRKPVRRQSLAVKLVGRAPTQPLADAAAKATESTPVLQPPQKPSRCRDYVIYRNNLGYFGFSLLTTMTPDMERCHVVFQAADSIAPLPVGRLVAVNFQPVKDKTACELHDIFNSSTESVRLRIQQLFFPVSVLQEMVADQISPVTYQEHMDYRRQRQAHPARRWVKRKLRGVARALSRIRDGITSCWT